MLMIGHRKEYGALIATSPNVSGLQIKERQVMDTGRVTHTEEVTPYLVKRGDVAANGVSIA